MFKKVISIAVALIMCCSFMTVLADRDNVFSDVTEENYSWAVKEIEEMASMGIIRGYSNDVFGPADEITKMQALLLCSRILGFSNENNILFIEKAEEIYEDVLAEYDIDYPAEVAYLLYKGILSTRELHAYIGEENINEPLKRYEAAVLMTKAMDKVDDAEILTGSSVFTDSADIPATAKPYVNYVYSIGLMLGMKNDGQVNEFAPLVNVNRAQMAVLLYRMMENMESETVFGTVESVNAAGTTIMFTDEDGVSTGINLGLRDDVIIKVDGYEASASDIQPQAVMAVTKRGGELYSIEAVLVQADEQISGVVESVTISSKGDTITVSDVDTDEKETYDIAETVSVTVSGSPSSLSSVKKSMYVTLEIKDGEVIVVDAEKREKSAVGTVEEIILTPDTGIVVKESGGDAAEYYFASKVTVTRNNKEATASDILVGDKVTLTLVYNRISKVVATSTSFTDSGTIDKILIATLPQITIISGGKEATYSVSRDAQFVLDGEEASIYDLRLGATVSLSIQGETVTKVTSTAPTTSSVITGVIDTYNSAYGFMNLNVTATDGSVSQTQVFLKKTGIKVIDSTTGKEIGVTKLSKGMTVSVTGVMNTGAFEATTVIVLP